MNESSQEILYAGLLRLRLADLLVQFVESGLEGFVPGGQVIVLFLIGILIEGDVGVFIDVLLYCIGNHLRFLQQNNIRLGTWQSESSGISASSDGIQDSHGTFGCP